MAGNGLHDLFTVFIFKTPPSADFVCGRKENMRASRAPVALAAVAPCHVTFLELLAGPDRRASLDAPFPGGTLAAIPQKNSRGDCCKSRRGFASAHASKAPL